MRQHGHANPLLRALCLPRSGLLLGTTVVRTRGGFRNIPARVLRRGLVIAPSVHAGISAVRIFPCLLDIVTDCLGFMVKHFVRAVCAPRQPDRTATRCRTRSRIGSGPHVHMRWTGLHSPLSSLRYRLKTGRMCLSCLATLGSCRAAPSTFFRQPAYSPRCVGSRSVIS